MMPGQAADLAGFGGYCCRYSDSTLLTKQDCENKCNADAGKCIAYSWKRSYTDCKLYAAALPDLAEVVGSRSLSPPWGHSDANCYVLESKSPGGPPPSPLQPGAINEIVSAKDITLVLRAEGTVEEYEAKADSVRANLRQELQCFSRRACSPS